MCYRTTIRPVMAVPWTAQSYVYVPGCSSRTEYVLPAAFMTTLFRKTSGGMPVDWMLCEPAAFQVQVTRLPAAIVSTAGFWLPLCALRKNVFPTVTCAGGPAARGSP